MTSIFSARGRLRSTAAQAWIGALILVGALLLSAAFILGDSGIVPASPMDQHFAETVNLQISHSNGHWVFQYPALQNSGGITSSLIAGLYKLVIPTNHLNLNWHIRILAMAAYLISSYLLVRAFLLNSALRNLAFLIIACSGFQLLQPSSDLFAGALLNLFLVGVQQRWPRALTALSLAGFGLSKVDMILAALALAILWAWWDQRSGRSGSVKGPLLLLIWLAILLAPSLLVSGANPLAGGRSMIAFLSAYAEFFGRHQFEASSSLPLDQAMASAQAVVFGGAQSLPEIVLKRPALYADFVGVSAMRSLPNLINVFKTMAIPIAIVYLHQRQLTRHRFLLWAALIAALCVILPAWLVIFVRIRYAAKVFAPLIVIALAGSQELAEKKRWLNQLAWLCGLTTIGWELAWFSEMAMHSHFK